jgi:hypothetical protein
MAGARAMTRLASYLGVFRFCEDLDGVVMTAGAGGAAGIGDLCGADFGERVAAVVTMLSFMEVSSVELIGDD